MQCKNTKKKKNIPLKLKSTSALTKQKTDDKSVVIKLLTISTLLLLTNFLIFCVIYRSVYSVGNFIPSKKCDAVIT